MGIWWNVLYAVNGIFLSFLVAYLVVLVNYKSSLHQVHLKPAKIGGGFDDLFVHRLVLLLLSALSVIFVIITSARQTHSEVECYVWNWLMGVAIGFEKCALFVFLYFKQDVIKRYVQEPRSRCDKFILCLIPLIAIISVVDASSLRYDFGQSERCNAILTSTTTGFLVLAQLLDIIISLSLLRSFLGVIKRHMMFVEQTPRATVTSSEPQVGEEGRNHRRKELEKTMLLNYRSCIMSVCSFSFAIIWSLTTPMWTDDKNVSLPLIFLVGCGAVFVDCTAMMWCSPQVWKGLWEMVSKTNSASSTKVPSQPTPASPTNDQPRKATLAEPFEAEASP
eukprot:TRINITY_DN3537_c0_g1_i1.p1 TRINITY_DN3537_c0_g1~~TRINITY_DN3537_c0_g1_i1.p1  ORF type:complete len:335 (+),score=61.22 TRINITY_DN3537_c0_g1_i1:168-1172(+)